MTEICCGTSAADCFQQRGTSSFCNYNTRAFTNRSTNTLKQHFLSRPILFSKDQQTKPLWLKAKYIDWL